MRNQLPLTDPFAMMMDPASVIQAMERSARLAGLERHVCRPLDRPLIARKGAATDEFDDAIDAQVDPDDE